MKPSSLWALAIAEIRSCVRLVRTWVFVALALILSSAAWIMQSVGHFNNSSQSPGASLNSPRYMMAALGAQMLFFFCIGIVFLTFDVRSRDIRDRIGEVMDTRPLSNLELLIGRLLGVVVLAAIPAITVVLFMYTFGWIAESLGAPFGSPIEPVSMFSFLVWDLVPNLVLWGSVTYFLAIVLRYRLLVAVVSFSLMLGVFLLMRNLPSDLDAALAIRGLAIYPSELASSFASFNTIAMRLVMLFISGGLLAIAAGLHPRIERQELCVPQLVSGITMVVLSCAGILGLIGVVHLERQQFARWAEAHAQHQSHSTTDIQLISGTVDIKPGRSIDLDLTLTLNPAADSNGDEWLLTLNPGYHIDELTVDGESTEQYEFENGLLTIPWAEPLMQESQVRIVARGMPIDRFAYLDGAVNPTQPESGRQTDLLFRLGQKSYIQHSKFVALMPGIHWLPSSGSAFGTTEWDTNGNDFYKLDIEVTAPKGWTVAGPGKRKTETVDSRNRSHFKPNIPIRDLALVGSEFERFSTEVQGIEFELLFSKKHSRFISALEDIGPALNDRIEERIADWNRAGIEYPFKTLSLIEVPVTLRVFGGGWRMDSVFAQPGILLMRESGLPIARFDSFLKNIPDDVNESEEKRSEYILAGVTQFFKGDQAGGNPLANVSKNFVLYQSMARDNGATAINYFINELTKLIVTGTDESSIFSVYVALSDFENFGSSGATISFDPYYEATPTIWHRGFTNRPPVWKRLSETTLSGIDPNVDPDIVSRILFLRTNALAHQILEHYGAEKSGAFLAELLQRYRGSTFTRNDFFETARDVGIDFDDIAGNWLDGRGLPGFIVANPKTERLQDTESGESVYQTSFVLRNDESVPGVVTVSYQTKSGDGAGIPGTLPAFRVDPETTLRIAFQDSQPTGQIWVTPEISLNRGYLQMEVPQLEDYVPSDSPVLPPIAEIEWRSPYEQSIIVDDLDDGFSVVNGEYTAEESSMPPWLAFLFRIGLSAEAEVDQGLPQFNLFSDDHGRWSRQESRSSHGKYRHTHAITRNQSEETSATFKATLPSPGKWRLEYHLPSVLPTAISSVSNVSFGIGGVGRSTSITISASGGGGSSGSGEEDPDFFLVEAKFDDTSETIEVEPSFVGRGWVELGTFNIESSEVEVVVSAGTSQFSVADAVKWTKVESEG